MGTTFANPELRFTPLPFAAKRARTGAHYTLVARLYSKRYRSLLTGILPYLGRGQRGSADRNRVALPKIIAVCFGLLPVRDMCSLCIRRCRRLRSVCEI